MENSENIHFDSLDSLQHLVFIRKNIIEYCTEIIKNSSSKKNEQTLVEQKINLLISQLNDRSNYNDDEILLIKTTLNQLFSAQIPLSQLASKIRDFKSMPPEIFR